MVVTEHAWSVAEAKARLSELLHEAESAGPQAITRRGVEIAFVVSAEDWHRKTKRTGSLAEFFARSPLAGSELDLSRGDTAPREVAL
jgi:prevent-host-death family protein